MIKYDGPDILCETYPKVTGRFIVVEIHREKDIVMEYKLRIVKKSKDLMGRRFSLYFSLTREDAKTFEEMELSAGFEVDIVEDKDILVMRKPSKFIEPRFIVHPKMTFMGTEPTLKVEGKVIRTETSNWKHDRERTEEEEVIIQAEPEERFIDLLKDL